MSISKQFLFLNTISDHLIFSEGEFLFQCCFGSGYVLRISKGLKKKHHPPTVFLSSKCCTFLCEKKTHTPSSYLIPTTEELSSIIVRPFLRTRFSFAPSSLCKGSRGEKTGENILFAIPSPPPPEPLTLDTGDQIGKEY